ncbi:glycine betaine ABC transporter substrate-binding protein [Actinophytocola gossypii]|uniref:Glycine betaine ABC transporter substrate-binding protein n=1 Tax=Actinophytocola gossypii TaxID=2812003 RepID=A0ABT2J398_9PSEU|nr:glycine betaine ABC transporter substrate-binding protein [Actinophytocola gossypii]MCT2582176.1 glycine betaine ABC transporter substrate-binding protein [Actinophytocola gossypii]
MRGLSVVAVVVGLVVLAAGCTLEEESPRAETGSGSIERIDELSGVSITVGSKEFDEQLVLGQIAILALQAAGADPVDETNITGTDAVRRSLTTGQIDLYWEYTGTAWVSFLKQTERVTDPEQLFDRVRTLDAENGVTWWARAPGNDTYAIAANREAAEEHGITTISDYAELANTNPAAASTCMGPEFNSRDDGLPGLAAMYDFTLPDAQRHEVNDAVVYTEVGSGKTCDFGSVASTDGRIPAQDLVVLEDDRSFFPVYNPAITIRAELATKYPGLEDVFTPIAEALDDETLLALNEQVSVEGAAPAKVAAEWLRKQGFIG